MTCSQFYKFQAIFSNRRFARSTRPQLPANSNRPLRVALNMIKTINFPAHKCCSLFVLGLIILTIRLEVTTALYSFPILFLESTSTRAMWIRFLAEGNSDVTMKVARTVRYSKAIQRQLLQEQTEKGTEHQHVCTYLPVLVMIISVPRELNFDQRSLFSRLIFKFLSMVSPWPLPPNMRLWSAWLENDG